jgi:hypothetical protein
MRLLQGEEVTVYGDAAVYEMCPPFPPLRVQRGVLARPAAGSFACAAVVVAGEL